ncbi:unnamed protein product [Citrullus colocynthis]|uniref:Uncharacterized protein n=1 Tax=Citrullus colocynthis TaxID=252529 RepID=A0ABP0YJS9_9ROSI
MDSDDLGDEGGALMSMTRTPKSCKRTRASNIDAALNHAKSNVFGCCMKSRSADREEANHQQRVLDEVLKAHGLTTSEQVGVDEARCLSSIDSRRIPFSCLPGYYKESHE